MERLNFEQMESIKGGKWCEIGVSAVFALGVGFAGLATGGTAWIGCAVCGTLIDALAVDAFCG